MNIHDISMKISGEMPVYPGNPKPEIKKYREIPEDSTTESEIMLGSHTGTHVDASSHVFKDGETVDEIDLENFYGNAQVVDLTESGRKINKEKLEGLDMEEEIILLKTENSLQEQDYFREKFAYITLDAVEYLIETGVKTLGVDYLSLVKFEGGKNASEAHKIANKKMTVIEGLDLSGIKSGNYVFSGMPLKIEADGAPIRAALIDEYMSSKHRL